MTIIREGLKLLSDLEKTQATEGKKAGTLSSGPKSVQSKALAPAFSNIAELTNQLASVAKDAVGIPLTILQISLLVPSKLVKRALGSLQERAKVLDLTQSAQFLQTASKIPATVDPDLEILWENLLIHSTSEDYHPTFAEVLAGLRAPDAKLLDSLIRMSLTNRELVPGNFNSRNLPNCFYVKKKLQTEKLALSLTVLERESLIATSNNLGNYFGESEVNARGRLDPQGHQVTPLGLALHRACKSELSNTGTRP